MDYSLQNLNKNLKLNDLSLSKFVEKLNLIGIEVDDIFYEKLSTNIFVDNIVIVLKIPANREDLLNEKFFLTEISTIFLLEIYQTWEKLKQNYFFLLRQKYLASKNYKTSFLPSTTSSIIKYLIAIENAKIKSSPLWIQNKLGLFGKISVNNITDILNLVGAEWGQMLNVFLMKDHGVEILNNFRIESLQEKIIYMDENQQTILLNPGTIVLKDIISNKIISVVGIIHSSFQLVENQQVASFFLEATFYDIHVNPLLLTTLNTKISLKYLRRACLQTFKFSFQRILTLLELLTKCNILPYKYCTAQQTDSFEFTKILSLKKKNLANFLNIKTPNSVLFQQAGLPIICETAKEYFFKLPIYRHDLAREIDLIEEYSRFVGYKNFVEILPVKNVQYTKSLFRQKYFIKNFFLNHGFYESINNPISDFEHEKDSSIRITNPLNNELSTLRRSLIPKLLEVFELNSRLSYVRTNFFEFGRTFKQNNQQIIEQDKLSGIFQLPSITNTKNSFSDWFIAKGFIETFLKSFRYLQIQSKPISSTNIFFHPTRSILFYWNNKILGIFGEINPILRKEKYSHLRRPIYLFELNIPPLQTQKNYRELEIIVQECILNSIRDSIPVESI
jgi:phenylalanyl-tRNA synthetase beta chain